MGLSTAERFGKEEWHVVLAARNKSSLQQQVDTLKSKGFTATSQSVDTADAEDIAALIKRVHSDSGAIDALHYNAACQGYVGLLDKEMLAAG
jgi:NAD(P)-dependent dehydrogenase (short-subunit alcohol dehydrogenase family)